MNKTLIYGIIILFVISIINSGCSSNPHYDPFKLENCSTNKDCPDGYACDNNKCHVCGEEYKICCANNQCSEGLVCNQGTCYSCGQRGSYCCDNDVCEEGLECINNVCRGCGLEYEPCCSGNECEEGYYCTTQGICKTCFAFSEDDTSELSSACGTRG